MNNALIHIFDKGACLTRKQMKDYTYGIMTAEERYAAEVHLCSCRFCSEAIDGIAEQTEQDATEAMMALDTEFLMERFSVSHPVVHLNSMAPAQTVSYAPPRRKIKHRARPFRHSSIMALILLLGAGYIWYAENKESNIQTTARSSSGAEMTETNSNITASTEPPPASERGGHEPLTGQALDSKADPQNAAMESTLNNRQQQRPHTLLIASEDEETESQTNDVQNVVDKKQSTTAEPSAVPPEISKIKKAAVQPVKLSAVNAERPVKAVIAKKEVTGKTAESTEAKKEETAPALTTLEQAEVYFNKGSYMAALGECDKEMNSTDERTRQKAAYMAARCYLNMGKKATAKTLLEELAEQKGPEKRAAKRLLKKMD